MFTFVGQQSEAGNFIYLDTLDGEVAMWDFDDNHCYSFDSAGEFYAWLKKQYEDLEVFSVPRPSDTPAEVWPLRNWNDRHRDLKEVIRSLGWPPRDGSGRDRENSMKELERRGPDWDSR